LENIEIIGKTFAGLEKVLAKEIEDLGAEEVLWVLICLANQTGVDLTDAFEKNMLKKTERDKFRHHNNEKLK